MGGGVVMEGWIIAETAEWKYIVVWAPVLRVCEISFHTTLPKDDTCPLYISSQADTYSFPLDPSACF